MPEQKPAPRRRKLNSRAAEEAAARAMQRTKARIENAALAAGNIYEAFNAMRFTHEIEELTPEREHAPATYMLLLHIRGAYGDMRIPLAGPLIKSLAEQQQAMRANQMADAMSEYMRYLAQRQQEEQNQEQ